jgi:hypothetical protein
MQRLLLLAFCVAAVGLAAAGGIASAGSIRTLVERPVADVSFPFWCDWGYDWEERCSRQESERLPIGGDRGKLWRAAIRFPMAGVPPGATVLGGELHLYFDGTCLVPGGGSRPCGGATFDVDAHPISSADWFHEREVEFDPWLSRVVVPAWSAPARLTWDLTDVVSAWTSGDLPDDGLLLKLSDAQEDFLAGGPELLSEEFPDVSLRPQLEIRYLDPEPG